MLSKILQLADILLAFQITFERDEAGQMLNSDGVTF
jgi:hypothetical protein